MPYNCLCLAPGRSGSNFRHQIGGRVARCAGLCLMGELGGQQLRPTHGSPATAGCGWMVSTTAVPMTLAAMMANARIETAIIFMAELSELSPTLAQALASRCDGHHKMALSTGDGLPALLRINSPLDGALETEHTACDRPPPTVTWAVGREPWSNLAKPGRGSFVFWMLPRAASSISKPGPIP
jgi:hypothetical protein